jgi:hypothetical protein
MNKWECDYAGCGNSCVGTGGAVGLRAIGWWFVRGMSNNCFCPAHRPDSVPCLERKTGEACAPCAGELEADKWQRQMEAGLGWSVSEPHAEWAARMRP